MVTIFLASGVNWRFHAWGPSVSGYTLTLDDYREFPASQKYVPDEHQLYYYDELDRLVGVAKSFSDGYNASYTYDKIGNLITKTEPSAISYTYPAPGAARPHAATQAGSNSYTYNANGDMLTRTENSISYTQQWDSENRLKVVTNTTANPDIITTFFYNGDGARVKKTELKGAVITTTFYAGAIEVLSTTQLITKTYYSAGGQLIAMREVTNTTGAGTLTYLHSDHLGSTSTTTCGNSTCGTLGAVLTRQSYYPYGGVRVVGNLPTDKTFTGQISDASTGLQYFNARYYSGSLGRFVSADTIVPGAGNPQAFNRYSYGFNNPLRYTDPTGHDPHDDDGNSMNDDCNYAGNGCPNSSSSQSYKDAAKHEDILENTCGTVVWMMCTSSMYMLDPYYVTISPEMLYSGDPIALFAQKGGKSKKEEGASGSASGGGTPPSGGRKPNDIGRRGAKELEDWLPIEEGQYNVEDANGNPRRYDGKFTGTKNQYVEIKASESSRRVSLDSRISRELNFDANMNPKPMWIFVNTQPSPGVINALQSGGIPWHMIHFAVPTG